MKYQFEGFKDGDRVEVTGLQHPLTHKTMTGTLINMVVSKESGLIQVDLVPDDVYDEGALLESGPGAWKLFSFETITKL